MDQSNLGRDNQSDGGVVKIWTDPIWSNQVLKFLQGIVIIVYQT